METPVVTVIAAAAIFVAAFGSAAARAAEQSALSANTDKLNARHRHDHRYIDRAAYQPQYYGRPTYYRPYPYDLPAPFFLGLAFGPLW